MGNHRLEGRRRSRSARPASRASDRAPDRAAPRGGRRKATSHRARRPLAPHYGRGGAVVLAFTVTVLALLAGSGLLPLDGDQRPAAAEPSPSAPAATLDAGAQAAPRLAPKPAAAPTPPRKPANPAALPAGSGTGKRIVFSESAQRVWLVAASGRVLSTYLVSGSLTDNLKPGTYAVFSRSRWAVGIEDSGVMEYFVRFTKGENAAIGFHTIPTKGGRALQTEAQLGTPQSHGCIRQRTEDAVRLWDFAPEGTKVVVL